MPTTGNDSAGLAAVEAADFVRLGWVVFFFMVSIAGDNRSDCRNIALSSRLLQYFAPVIAWFFLPKVIGGWVESGKRGGGAIAAQESSDSAARVNNFHAKPDRLRSTQAENRDRLTLHGDRFGPVLQAQAGCLHLPQVRRRKKNDEDKRSNTRAVLRKMRRA